MRKILPARRRSPRILVVDDNPDVVLLMQELLASRGYDAILVRVSTVRNDADGARVTLESFVRALISSLPADRRPVFIA